MFLAKAGFAESRRNLYIATLGDAYHLRAHPKRIPNVFQRVGTSDVIEFLVFEWVRFTTADVSLYPCGRIKMFFFTALKGQFPNLRVIAARGVGFGIHHMGGAIERARPTSDV